MNFWIFGSSDDEQENCDHELEEVREFTVPIYMGPQIFDSKTQELRHAVKLRKEKECTKCGVVRFETVGEKTYVFEADRVEDGNLFEEEGKV